MGIIVKALASHNLWPFFAAKCSAVVPSFLFETSGLHFLAERRTLRQPACPRSDACFSRGRKSGDSRDDTYFWRLEGSFDLMNPKALEKVDWGTWSIYEGGKILWFKVH